MINKDISFNKLNKYYMLVALIFFSFRCFSYEPANKNISTNSKELFEYLQSIYQKKTLSGYNVYGHTPGVYEQTGKNGAIWARDLEWFGDPIENVKHAQKMGYILTIHWHWGFDDDSAWVSKRKTQVNIEQMVTPGSPENIKAMNELKLAADKLQAFSDADIPVLWRPLHEIDGGWFWWTDLKKPKNTAKLWHMLYTYLVHERKLNNLIWVYSAGVGKKNIKTRQDFYPGNEYVDISGIDLYGVDYEKGKEPYLDYYDLMSEVSPNKMLALGESQAIPNPDLMSQGKTPKWLYVLPWEGVPSVSRSVDWALYTSYHDHIITLDELPYLGNNKILPDIGIQTPTDNGSTWFSYTNPHFVVSASDRDGEIVNVTYYANNILIGKNVEFPYQFTWRTGEPGSYDVVAKATDNDGLTSVSNKIRIVIGKSDIAKNKPVVASSGKNPSFAVDGNTLTSWSADKTDNAWLYVDLKTGIEIDNINLHWGWKIHPEEIEVAVANNLPANESSWSDIYKVTNIPYEQWKSTQKISFKPVVGRYVRVKATKRAGHQYWGGYQLTSFEIPVNNEILEGINKKKTYQLIGITVVIILIVIVIFINLLMKKRRSLSTYN